MANQIKYYTPNDINAFLRGEADWTRQYILANSAGNTPYGMSEIPEAQVRQLAQQDPKIRLLGEVTREQLLAGATPQGQYSVDNGRLVPTSKVGKYVSPEKGLKAAGGGSYLTPQQSAQSFSNIQPAYAQPLAGANIQTPQIPTQNLQPGMTGQAVKQLQDYLVSQGVMTREQVNTGYGTYGPQTTAAVAALQQKLGVDNSTGVGYFGPRTIASINAATGTKTTVPPTPSTTTIGNPAGTPTLTGAPNLSTAQAPTAADLFIQSVSSQLAGAKAQADAENARRIADYQTQTNAMNKKMDDLQILQNEGMTGNLKVVTDETTAKKAELEAEKARFEENYNANQALVNELDGLLTTGNQVIQQMRDTTGLSSIMEPRIAKTMSDVSARAGVIEAVIAARNGQIGQAQNQLSAAVSTIESIANDQINYYESVVNFYGSLKDENGKILSTLKGEQKDYLDAKLISLNQDVANAQRTADIIKEAMLDPDTALAYASAGVSLNDTPEQINQKLAVYEQYKANQKQDEWSEPYSLGGDIVQKNTKTGEIRVAVNVAAGGNGTSTLNVIDVARYNELYPDAGVTAGDTEAQANAKVQASNSPEAKTKNLIVAAQAAGNSYETVIAEINKDTTIKDKAAAIKIADEVYGTTAVPISKIEQDIAQLKQTGILTNSDIASTLRVRGYTQDEIAKSSVGSFMDKIGSFLFGVQNAIGNAVVKK